MFAVHRAFLASFIVFLLSFCMPSYAEKRFTSKDFLEWKEDERSSYIQIARDKLRIRLPAGMTKPSQTVLVTGMIVTKMTPTTTFMTS